MRDRVKTPDYPSLANLLTLDKLRGEFFICFARQILACNIFGMPYYSFMRLSVIHFVRP
ncbi:hypothetical protein [Tropheryma whipplei]|uniref:hypothetical protein n=1 Tax=Tropheryma whipplei TaxID=2039 RepID=UPI0004B879C3|nr:hypothetical protein [Tropheryma whipplei]